MNMQLFAKKTPTLVCLCRKQCVFSFVQIESFKYWPNHRRRQGVQGAMLPQIFSTSRHFVLSEAGSQTQILLVA